MKFYFLRNKAEYDNLINVEGPLLQNHSEFIKSHIPEVESDFFVNGFSYTAKKQVNFLCNFKHGGGYPNVNWREHLVCPESGFNNRMRLSIHLVDTFLNLLTNSDIYIMEKVTPMYPYLSKRYPNLIGSEFLGNEVPLGEINSQGIRNEDATALTFPERSLDAILSYDVFEHIPNFKLAFQECCRTLREGGRMLWSAPFSLNSEKNIILATLDQDGNIKHLQSPEYHGNPVGKGQGILCYQRFGWEILDDLKQAGFSDAFAVICWSNELCYFTPQIQFLAIKKNSFSFN
jgi:hypothetical protein